MSRVTLSPLLRFSNRSSLDILKKQTKINNHNYIPHTHFKMTVRKGTGDAVFLLTMKAYTRGSKFIWEEQ